MIGKFHDRYPTVKQLSFHLEGEQYLVFEEDKLNTDNVAYIKRRIEESPQSQMMAWLTANKLERKLFKEFVQELNEENNPNVPQLDDTIDWRDAYYKTCRDEYRKEFFTHRLENFIKQNPDKAGIAYNKKLNLRAAQYKPSRIDFRKGRRRQVRDRHSNDQDIACGSAKKDEEYDIKSSKQEMDQRLNFIQSGANINEELTQENETTYCVQPLYDDESLVEQCHSDRY